MQQDASSASLPPPGGGNNAQAMSQMGFDHLIHNFDVVGWVVFITLVLMSVLSIYFIIFNLIRNTMVRSRMDRVIHTFWETPSAQEAIRFLEEQPKSEPFSKIALDAAIAAQHHSRHEGSRLVEALNRSEFIDRSLRQAVARESMRLEGGLTVLATVGSTAPFVGLLGTVWGIYHALLGIGAAGQVSIDQVAGPIGEALIMTAMGLLVAIPAVLGYNALVRGNKTILARLGRFAHDLHAYYVTGARVTNGATEANVVALKRS